RGLPSGAALPATVRAGRDAESAPGRRRGAALLGHAQRPLPVAVGSLGGQGIRLSPLLRVSDLQTYYFGFRGSRVVKAVDGVSFTLEAGETFGLVGESGSGKTTACHSLVRLLASGARIVGGRIELDGEGLLTKSPAEMTAIRGRRIATILQDPMASLDPLFSIYSQVAEPAYYHRGLRGRALRQRVKELLGAVRIPSPESRMRELPHQM